MSNQKAQASHKNSKVAYRWDMVFAGAMLMLCFGTVYAWSYFQEPLMQTFGWNNAQVSLVFSLAIFFLGMAAAVGGVILPNAGPRKIAMIGSALFCLGYLLAAIALSLKSLALLYLGYSLIGGTGLGLGYVTPVATVSKWFQEKKGLATGMVIMGFGFGALFMSKVIAPIFLRLYAGNLVKSFLTFALLFAAITIPASLAMKDPPESVPGQSKPPRSSNSGKQKQEKAKTDISLSLKQASKDIFSKRFLVVWMILFCNISAGISIIGFQSPMFQELILNRKPSSTAEALASMGATLIAVTSIFNGVGRLLWGAFSDRFGRMKAYRLLLGSEMLIFLLLIFTRSPWVFAICACWILFCYGGGFGMMPATISELFGPQKMTIMYGAVLTAWSLGGVIGPQITAYIKDTQPSQAIKISFIVGTVFIAIGFLFSIMISDKKK
ncbi:MAG: putative MFS-type transporter YhjX [Spirochaetes bacterium ADurb.Bin110]|nr:MAG: putative MFS-type transporter YhjX [Spirochaetes bacterium ADurb.Bin110]